MKQRFGDRFGKVMAVAREEAFKKGDGAVTPEHLLLSLLRTGSANDLAKEILRHQGVDAEALYSRIGAMTTEPNRPKLAKMPEEDSQAVEVLYSEAALEAERADVDTIGPEHILLALLGLPSIATLFGQGIDRQSARETYCRLLQESG